jgi:Flp pilus assembly pilin Flp
MGRSDRREGGATLIEYALLGFLIAVACVGIVTAAGGNVETLWVAVCTAVNDAVSGAAICN